MNQRIIWSFVVLLLASHVFGGAPVHASEPEAQSIEPAARIRRAEFTSPPRAVPTAGMPDGPLLGNGDVGVVIGGPPEAQRFHIGKNDFWTSFQGHPNTRKQSKIITVGRVELRMPALKGATYRQVQDMTLAEVRGTFSKDELTVRTRSWVDANENLLVTQVQCEGAPLKFSVLPVSGPGEVTPTAIVDSGELNVGREQHGRGRWYFDGEIADLVITDTVLDAKPTRRPGKSKTFDGKSTWYPQDVPKMDTAVSVAAWIKIKNATHANYIVSKGGWNHAYSLGLSDGRLRWSINGQFVQTEQPLPKGKWLYVVATFDGLQMNAYVDGELRASYGSDGSEDGWFTRKADALEVDGREVAVVTRVLGREGLGRTIQPGETATIATAILTDLDDTDFLPAAKRLVNGLSPESVAALSKLHRAWWEKFWSRSFIEIPDKEIEKHWYAALYLMGSCSRAGEVAPGLWGSWVTTDNPAWQGDFHLNYNFEAPFYIVYGSNHPEVSLPFYQAISEWMPHARKIASDRGWKGVHFPVGIGPWGLSGYGHNVDHGQRSNAAYVALNFIWYYQYTQDLDWLRERGYPYLREVAAFWEDYLKLEDGRYFIHNDAIHEGSGNSVNSILSLGLVRNLFRNMLIMSRDLDVDAHKRAKWQDILDKLSDFPTQQHGDKTIFRYTENGLAWYKSNTLGIQQIFPAGAIGLDSNPKLLEVSRNTIEVMNRWADYNGFSSFYTAAARVGYDPNVILKNLRLQCDSRSLPNGLLYYGGGGIENASGFLAVNEMLLQSHEGVIRLFPVWPKDQDARFGNLRAVGAFLVSAELENGVVSGVTIVSEKGKECTVQNPWPGKTVRVSDGKSFHGDRFTFQTRPGETIELKAQ